MKSIDKKLQIILATVGLLSSIGIGLFLFTCWSVGICYIDIDSTIVSSSICLQDSTLEYVLTVPQGTEKIYLCGEIEGTTPRPGRLRMFYGDKVIWSESVEYRPGIFYHPLSLPPDEQGQYRVEITYAKVLLTKAEFTVSATK